MVLLAPGDNRKPPAVHAQSARRVHHGLRRRVGGGDWNTRSVMAQTGHARHPAVEAALRTASTLTGMQVVFVGRFEHSTFVFDEVMGELPGLVCGQSLPSTDTLCARMLAGAPRMTADAARHPAYA